MKLKEILGNIGCTALSTVAPPFGGMAANAIKESLGLDENATEKDIAQAVGKATPEQVIALKQVNNDFIARMKELDIDIMKLDNEDSKSARGFAEKVGLTTVNALAVANTLFVLAVIIGVGLLIHSKGLNGLDDLAIALLTLIVREVFAKQEQIYNFFYGSSHGSKQKTEIMKNETPR